MPSRPRVSRSRLTPAMAEEPPATPARAPAKKATRSRALSADTLEQLGARQLAELLMAQAKSDPALARLLRLVLAGTDGGTRLATEVEKRLRTIQRSRGFIEWDKVRPLVRELEGLRETIAGPLAAVDPRAAAAQMRLFLDLADGVFERSDDGSGSLGSVFRQAGADLGGLGLCFPAGILLRWRPNCWRAGAVRSWKGNVDTYIAAVEAGGQPGERSALGRSTYQRSQSF